MTKRRAKRKLRRQHQLVDSLSLPLALEEAGPPRVTGQLVFILTLFVAAAIVWASVTQVGAVAVTSGQVVPEVPLQSVQHLEGGIVDEILVDEGVEVAAGQPLLRLRAASTEADLDQLRSREAALAYEVERLRAYVEDREPNFVEQSAGFASLREGQLDILATQREADESRRQVLQLQAQQKRLERDGLKNRRVSLREQKAILTEQLEVREKLLARGLSSKLEALTARRAVAALQAELAEIDADLAQAGEGMREYEARIVEFEATSNAEAFDAMADAAAALAEVRQTVAKLADRSSRLLIRAPADGVVQGLSVKTVGGVVAPGQELMKIVPVRGSLVADVRVSPKDVGYVQVGQSAEVKVSAFDVARLGGIAGQIIQISPSTFLDEAGSPYYRARIKLDRNYVGESPGRNVILPGMVVTADVQTGARSILQYLAGPAYRALSSALRER